MWLILEAFPKGVIRRSVLEAEAADGARVTVGTQSSRRSAIPFADRAAGRSVVLNPALASGELYTNGRLGVTQGSIFELLDLVRSNQEWNEPSRWARTLTRLQRANFLRWPRHAASSASGQGGTRE